MDKAMEKELTRLEALDDLKLYDCIVALEDDPAPQHVKTLILQKIRSILNQRIGIAG